MSINVQNADFTVDVFIKNELSNEEKLCAIHKSFVDQRRKILAHKMSLNGLSGVIQGASMRQAHFQVPDVGKYARYQEDVIHDHTTDNKRYQE